MTTNRISVLVALEGADEGLRTALTRAEGSLDRLGSSARSAGDRATQSLATMRAGFGTLSEQFDRTKLQLLALFATLELSNRIRQVIEIADAWNNMTARLKLATAGSQEYAVAQKELFAIAQRIGVPIAETATLYGKLQQAVRQLGGEQKDALQLTETISQALRISGVSAAEAQSSLLQLGQALASGALRGDEFNSVVENSPRLAQALADGLNVPIGRLRKMAEQGQLTADVVVNALLSQKDRLASEYAQLPATVSQSFTRVANAFALWISQVDQSTGFTRKLAEALDGLAKNLDTVMSWLKTIVEVGLAVLVYRMIPLAITAWEALGAAAVAAASTTVAAWVAANQSLGAALASIGLLRSAFFVLGAFLVGWEIGTWLSGKFEIVRKAGIFMVEVLMRAVEELRYRWEVFAAVFSSDTIAEATKRHQERLGQMKQIFADMYADASKSGEASTQAMNQAATAAEEIAKRLAAVRQGTQEAVGRGIEALGQAMTKLDQQIKEIEQAATKATQTINQTAGAMAQSYQELITVAQSALQQKLTLEQQHYQQSLAALDQASLSERQKIAETAQLQADTLTQQTQLERDASIEALRLIDQEFQAKKSAAGATQQEVNRVEAEMLATKRQTLTEALSAYRQHVDALNAEANRHLAEIQRIEEQKRLLTQSTADRIRELQRSTMTDYEAYQDKQTQIAQLQKQSRDALADGEFAKAKDYSKQAADLAAQTASAVKQGDQEVVTQKEAVGRAIKAIQDSEKLTIEALDAEAQAHKKAAQDATSARQSIEAVLRETESQIDSITNKLKAGLKLTIEADTSKFEKALADLDKALIEKERLLTIKGDLEDAKKKLLEYEQLLKDGKTLPVDADTTKAQDALRRLGDYAKEQSNVELRMATDKAQASIQNVQKMLTALSDIQTQSQHTVNTNTDAARSQVLSLNGLNTSSTHTIYVQRVEQNAVGGLVGAARFAAGGPVAGGFVPMRGGRVPGTGNGDTVPRLLDAGSFVLRKEAVRHYGQNLLARFADGGPVGAPRRLGRGGWLFGPRLDKDGNPIKVVKPKKNREVAEALELIDVGMKGMRMYTSYLEFHYGTSISPGYRFDMEQNFGKWASEDRNFLGSVIGLKTLTKVEQSRLNAVQTRWNQAMSQGLIAGQDLEREIITWREQQDAADFFRSGGAANAAASDTVPALLTPGEYVVRKEVVNRLGAGFFDALNRLQAPKEAVAARVRGYASGGVVAPLAGLAVQASRSVAGDDWSGALRRELAGLVRPVRPTVDLRESAAPSRTVRVELAAGDRKVNTTVDARDESRLLQILETARARTR
jgi:tape measure domain-containing protein